MKKVVYLLLAVLIMSFVVEACTADDDFIHETNKEINAIDKDSIQEEDI